MTKTHPPTLKRKRKGSVLVEDVYDFFKISEAQDFGSLFPPTGAHIVKGKMYVPCTEYQNMEAFRWDTLHKTLEGVAQYYLGRLRSYPPVAAVKFWLVQATLGDSEIGRLYLKHRNWAYIPFKAYMKIIAAFNTYCKSYYNSLRNRPLSQYTQDLFAAGRMI